MKLTINYDELTVGDVEDFEAACGIDITALGPGAVPTKALAPLIWITQRRVDPSFTLEDARRVRFTDLEIASPPAGAGPAGSTAGSRRSRSSTGTPRRKSVR